MRVDSRVIACLLTVACGQAMPMGGNDGGPDAAVPDAGPHADAGTPDAGAPDAGPPDSGAPDAGQPDAGTPDSGAPDAGPAYDGGTLAPTLPCTDALAAVYMTPTGLPAFSPAARGDIIRCAHDFTLDAGGVATQLSGKGVTGITPSTGTDVFRITYRTERADGGEGAGTAKVFLPLVARGFPLPVIVVAHGSTGMADSCAPSMNATDTSEMTMPFAAQGYAVIAPDFAGLGNEGAQGYLDARDTAHSTLDAARALRKLLPVGALSTQVAIVGHSQGGGAALASQALVSSYGADGELAAVAVFAAEYQTRLDSFGFVTALRQPTNLTILLGVAKPPVYVMREYAYEMNQRGSATGGDAFPAAKSAALVSDVTTQCLVLLGGTVQAASPYVGDLIDDTLRTSFLSCVDDAGCSGTGKDLFDYLSGNMLKADPGGAPVLYVQGLNDIIMPAAEEAACNVEKLNSDGIVPALCVDSGGDHTTVVVRNAAYVVDWVAATLAGTALPVCPQSGTLPACTP